MRAPPKHLRIALRLALLLGSAGSSVLAQPTGGNVIAGSASFASSPSIFTVTQSTSRAIISWQDFSIAAGASVKFVQPDAASATLNRVISGLPSTLAGTLEANGSVFLINPNGILIGAGARIDTGGFLASTLDVTDQEFLAGGDLHLSGGSNAAVTNLGVINALGGDVFLIARQVENSGTIAAANGTAGLAAGSEVLLTTGGDERLFVQATSVAGTVVNAGTITATTAELKAAGGNAYALAINNPGVVRATGTAMRNGQIWLVASGDSEVDSDGTLDVSSATGLGGGVVVTGGHVLIGAGARIDASGATGGGKVDIGGGWQGNDASIVDASAVAVQPGAVIDARATLSGNGGTVALWSQDFTDFDGSIAATGGPNGGNGGQVETSSLGTLQVLGLVDTNATNGVKGNWLLDPSDVTIASTGVSGTTFANTFTPTADSVILASSIAASLDSGANVTITTGTGTSAGSINVNAPISWSANSTLTLSAYLNVSVNADITATGATVGLVLTPNNPANIYGGVFSLNNRASITLTGLNPSLTISGVTYKVVNNLGVAGDATTAPVTPTLQGIAATGNLTTNYALGSNIDASATSSWNAGLGFTPIGNAVTGYGGTFTGLGHTITGLTIARPTAANVGLFGYLTGSVSNLGVVGGTVSGQTSVGGLVGYNAGSIATSYATGNVSGNSEVGGLAGYNAGNVGTSYATGAVSGNTDVGGLLGRNDQSSVSQVYATGNVSGTTNVGGLIGYISSYHESTSDLQDTYALGNVTGVTDVGGLVGLNEDGDIYRSYAAGKVSGTTNVGGLIGESSRTDIYMYGIVDCSWDVETSGQAVGIGLDNGITYGLNGRTTAEMMSMSGFDDISDVGGGGTIWRIYEGQTMPLLTCFLYPLTITANNDSTTYSGTAYSGGKGVTYSLTNLNPAPAGTLSYAGTAQSAVNAGSYTITPAGLYSVQQGYDIIDASGTLTINKAILSVTGTRVFDGTSIFAGINLTATGVNGETFTMTGAGNSGNLSSKNVQTNQSLASFSGLALGASSNGGLVSNYGPLNIAVNPTSVSVTPASVSASTSNVVKIYDGGTTASGSPVLTLGTLFGSDTLTGGSFAYVGKDVGIGDKTVTVSGITVGDGNGGNNYTVTQVNNTTSTINKADLTLSGTQVYNGTTSFAGSGLTATGVDGETFTVTGAGASGNLTTKDVQTGQLLASVTGLAVGTGNTGAAISSNYNALATAGSSVSVTPANLILTGTRVYDGTTTFAGSDLTATGVNGETFIVTGSGATGNLSTKDVQTNQLLASVTGLAKGSGNTGAAVASNYQSLAVAGSSVSVTPASLTVSSSDVVKTYDGGTTAAGSPVVTLGAVFTGDALVGGTFAFTNKDVGIGNKTVTVSGITVSDGNGGANYNLTLVNNTTSTINKADLVLSGMRVYDATTAFAGSDLTATGVDGETFTVMGAGASGNLTTKDVQTGQLLASVTGLAVGTGNTGAAISSNYNALATAGSSVSVTPANLILTGTRVYDGTTIYAGRDLTATGVNGETFTVTGAGASGNLTTKNVQSGQALATVTGLAVGTGNTGAAVASNYHGLATVGSTVSVTPASLTVSSVDVVKTYDGSTMAAGTPVVTLGTLYAGDTLGGGSFAFTNKDVGIGNKTVTVSGVTVSDGNNGNNYALTLADNTTSTINPAALTLTADNATKIYGQTTTFAGTEFTAAGLVNGETVGHVVLASIGAAATANVAGSPYAITATAATGGTFNAANYTLSYVEGVLTITPATLTYVATPASRLVSESNPSFSGTVTGFVPGESLATATTGTLTFGTPATSASPVGTYAIDGSGLTANAGNYVFVQAPSNATAFTISALVPPPALVPLTITANDQTKIYGAILPVFTATYSGFVNGDSAANVTGLKFSTAATMGSNVGTYVITPFGATAPASYVVSYVPGTLTILPAALSITADDATRLYGANNPAFDATFTGFVNDDGPAVVSGLSFSTPATPSSVVGDYRITPLGAIAANYTLTFHNGTLHVLAPTVAVGTVPVPVITTNSQPVISTDYAVILEDTQPVLVPVDSQGGVVAVAGVSIEGQLTITLGDAASPPLARGNLANVSSPAVNSVASIHGLNLGTFELVASADSGPSSGVGRDYAQMNEPGIFRESTVNMGGFNVIYHEALTDAREQAKSNTALGSSYREFSDADNPQVNFVRAKVERKSSNRAGSQNSGGPS